MIEESKFEYEYWGYVLVIRNVITDKVEGLFYKTKMVCQDDKKIIVIDRNNKKYVYINISK